MTSGSIHRSSAGRPAPVHRSCSFLATAKRSSAVGGMPSSLRHRPTTGHLYFSTSGSTASMRGCSPLMELMNGTLPPLSMTAWTPASRAVGVGRVDHELHVGDAHDDVDEPQQIFDLVAAGDAAVDVQQAGPSLDLVHGEGLDELGIARLDRLGDLLARPVDRFTHQQHFGYLHSGCPVRNSVKVYAKAHGLVTRRGRAPVRGRPAAAHSSGRSGGTTQSGSCRRRSRERRSRARPGARRGARRSAGP